MKVIFDVLHIVTCIFNIEIMHVLLNSTKTNLVYTGFLTSILRTHVNLD